MQIQHILPAVYKFHVVRFLQVLFSLVCFGVLPMVFWQHIPDVQESQGSRLRGWHHLNICHNLESASSGHLAAYFGASLCKIGLPHAGMEYDLLTSNADIIITEVGGKLAHLSKVAGERQQALIKIPNACKRFPTFTKMSFNFYQLKLSLSYSWLL